MYRVTRKAAVRRAWRPRPEVPVGEQRPPHWRPPELRRRITIEDFDGPGARTVTIELRRTRRIDTYAVIVDGKPWKRMGWSRVLDVVRRGFPRVASPRNEE